jgi:hypothetical protein
MSNEHGVGFGGNFCDGFVLGILFSSNKPKNVSNSRKKSLNVPKKWVSRTKPLYFIHSKKNQFYRSSENF